ncbi:MAG: hypothetical protein M1816_006545 [Peltula sp. TS41687]|nr:MAG: hypothetical protein M1816_006545 [Peltula sp. TS41687]
MSSPTITIPSVDPATPIHTDIQSLVHHLGRQYLASNPGFDTVNGNNRPHDLLRRCCIQGEQLTDAEYSHLADFLLYRTEIMRLAEDYVQRMGLLSSFMPAADFHRAVWRTQHWVEPYDSDALEELRSRVYRLFPKPSSGTAGRFCMKGVYYVGAACASARLDGPTVGAKLDVILAGWW